MASKYALAASASSTAALAASNAATSASTAATYYAKALHAIMHAMNPANAPVNEDAVAEYLAGCMAGAAAAAEEARQARCNAAAAFALAADAAGELAEGSVGSINELERWDWESHKGDEDEEEDDHSGKYEWESARSLWSGPDANDIEDPYSPTNEVPDCAVDETQTLWDADTLLAHAESNNILFPTPANSPIQNENEKPRWGKEIGTWAGGLQTKQDASRTMYTAYGEITEILHFGVFVAVEPTAGYPLSSFSSVSEGMLREIAADETQFMVFVPEKGEMAWGFLDPEQPGDELKVGFGRVVDVSVNEKVYLVKNGNEDMGVWDVEFE
ncbi:hypothetical protein BDV18DRAFT_158720 [Aspergillus unguis]